MGRYLPPLPPNEAERLAALYDLHILDSAPEAHFDAVCRTAAALFSVPIAFVSLVDSDRQWFKAKCGIAAEGTPRDVAFCAYAILSDDVLVVENAAVDPRFAINPLVVGDLAVRFYAGAPLILRSGIRVGTICIFDTKPCSFSEMQRTQLQDLARIVVAHIELHQGRLTIEAALAERTRSEALIAANEARYRALADALPQMVWVMTSADGSAIYTNERFRTYYGSIGPQREERTSRNHPADTERMAEEWQRAVTHEHTYAVEGRLRRHDGTYRWHKLVMVPVRQNGTVVEWLGTALDIEDIVTARSTLEHTTDLLRLAQEAAGAGVWQRDLDDDVVRHSPMSARMHGFLGEPDLSGWIAVSIAEWAARVHPDDLAQVRAMHAGALRNGTTYKVEFRVRQSADMDDYRWLMGFGRVIRDETSGRPLRVVGLNLDITDRRTTEDALAQSQTHLRASEERLALALDSGNDGLFDWNVTTGKVWYSDRWQTMLGYKPGEIEPHILSWERLVHPDDLHQARTLLTEHFGELSATYSSEHRLRSKSGEYTWVLGRGRVVARDEQGAPLRMVGTSIDITERKASEQRIAYMARHDVLTGLPNRTVFHEHLEQRLAEVRRGRGQAALLCLDLDRFKSINDMLGHPAGDELLCQIATRLRATVRGGDVVVRLGGDEFAIIVSHLDHARQASVLAQRVIDAVGQPLDLGGHLVTVGISIGIAFAPTNGDTSETLFKNADLALYRAKASARNTYCFYEAGMDAAVEARMQLEFEMREAITCGSFALHYQPVLRLADHRIVGFEALMRWPHPKRGMIAPDEFIPSAEETGLIVPLGSWALQEACREAASWPDHLRIAVNVSAVQFQQPGLEQGVMSALAASGLAPHRLVLEVTESVLVQDAEAVIACLHRLKSLGVRIALDDFGTGYSSLSYLRRFPFDRIKIDRSFISEIGDPGAAAIVRAVVGIAMQLGATVTAEGVETTAQLEQVRSEGCMEVQGYLVSRPLPADRAIEFISSSASIERAYKRLCEAERSDQHRVCAA
ncbi:putative diguanylate cyclase (GGDEF)/phosphodiesterase (EAL), with GAF and two PAS/PAC sensor domains [Methylorubrum extorquens DM4]|uniref:Diguanylate cyclase (GGDEF)/phosphodiesterase (EAL), with GAF and two PAS/PAC sensor domains n=1 Tax=Methylorubrum extorquens (strain DSM 6343 / CIP 106787 / DM4) TaxID=661410 RepID=C7CCD7_METED|nr:EAL domain-containing protein [Methylorubrum extorquens]CAX22483.1 putative diguanylate cyclase (GGDEF)/phosphodiesterase (EAL), with GAF and two PAS/PAC sensor domains [Methylorubrum extorquens DM4]